MSSFPIEEFENQEQLDKCLSYWKEKLGLQNWLIKARVVKQEDFELDGCSGENSFVYESRTSDIHIIRKEDFPEDTVERYCAESILVHELLHCMYCYLNFKGKYGKKSYEIKYLKVNEHQKLDSMSKTLVMVKYNLPLEYFYRDFDVEDSGDDIR